MEKEYNDELMPEDFEKMAKEYSQKLREKGFVFVNLQAEENTLLLTEVLVLFEKMKACLKRLSSKLDGQILLEKIDKNQQKILNLCPNKKPHKFRCVENEFSSFLSLISLQNTLVLKLMSLSVKSDNFQLFYDMIADICGVFSSSFSSENFVCEF